MIVSFFAPPNVGQLPTQKKNFLNACPKLPTPSSGENSGGSPLPELANFIT